MRYHSKPRPDQGIAFSKQNIRSHFLAHGGPVLNLVQAKGRQFLKVLKEIFMQPAMRAPP